MKHSELPWKMDDCLEPTCIVSDKRGIIICEPPEEFYRDSRKEWKANAAQIIRAVNAYPDLLDALEIIANSTLPMNDNAFTVWRECCHIARAAIEKAKP